LVHNKGLVKTIEFKDPRYVGDPINSVKIFNEKEVDELMVLDIDATVEGREPDFDLIRNLAAECRMPLCYGGGVTTVDHVKKIISLGVEKVAISTSAIKNPKILSEIGSAVGVQSIVVVVDVRKRKGIFAKEGYDIYLYNGKMKIDLDLNQLIDQLNSIGIGELVINSIDQDGKQQGYDMELVELVRKQTEVPMSVLGGAGTLDDLRKLISNYKIIGAAAGSLFVFKGKYRAVLINYPNREEKIALQRSAMT
jgi:cyclase